MNSTELRLLVVEDDDAIREGITDLLQLEGFDVTESKNGKEALDLLTDLEPDLVISDVMMPVMDGHTLLENYKNLPNSKNIPFLFLTALTDKTDIRKGMNLGADDYLTKPFSRQELLQAIHSQYEKYSDRKEVFEAELAAKFEENNRLTQREKNSLMQEMHHRVKHNLAVVSAFFELGEMFGDERYISTIKERVLAMASVHEQAYSNEFICQVNTEKLVNNVLDELFDEANFKFIRQAKRFEIDINQAIPLGLLLYEVLSLLLSKKQNSNTTIVYVNSYPLVGKACLVVSINADSELDLNDLDNDVEGLLIHSYISQLNGSYKKEFTDSGTMFTFEYPV